MRRLWDSSSGESTCYDLHTGRLDHGALSCEQKFIDSITMSAPFSRACWLALAPPTLLGRGNRHCHGINCQNHDWRLLELYCDN
jgi:hypothetical protein